MAALLCFALLYFRLAKAGWMSGCECGARALRLEARAATASVILERLNAGILERLNADCAVMFFMLGACSLGAETRPMANASWLWMGIGDGVDYSDEQVWADADGRWDVFSPAQRQRIQTCQKGLQLLRSSLTVLLAGLVRTRQLQPTRDQAPAKQASAFVEVEDVWLSRCDPVPAAGVVSGTSLARRHCLPRVPVPRCTERPGRRRAGGRQAPDALWHTGLGRSHVRGDGRHRCWLEGAAGLGARGAQCPAFACRAGASGRRDVEQGPLQSNRARPGDVFFAAAPARPHTGHVRPRAPDVPLAHPIRASLQALSVDLARGGKEHVHQRQYHLCVLLRAVGAQGAEPVDSALQCLQASVVGKQVHPACVNPHAAAQVHFPSLATHTHTHAHNSQTAARIRAYLHERTLRACLRSAQPLPRSSTGGLLESCVLRRHDGIFMKKICGSRSWSSESGCEEFLHDSQPAPQPSPDMSRQRCSTRCATLLTTTARFTARVLVGCVLVGCV